MKKFISLFGASFALLTAATAYAAPSLTLINTYKTDHKNGTEIVSVKKSAQKITVSNSIKGTVDVYSIAKIDNPKLLQRVELNLNKGESITSVAVHPNFDYFLAAIQAAEPTANGRIEVRDLNTGALIKTVATGIGPDAVVIDKTGSYAAVPNEGEPFVLDRSNMTYSSPVGSISVLKLDKNPQSITVKQIALTDLTGTEGFVSVKHNRYLERGIDWDQNGEITEEPIDLNNSGDIEKGKVNVGSFHGQTVKAKEKKGEYFMFPITGNTPDLLEPEYPVFSSNGATVWVTLQENNGIIVIDSKTATIKNVFGLGITRHAADTDDDDVIEFDDNLVALREPDGLSITHDNKYIVTADEGDTEPKAAKTKKGPTGGGRTLSVFNAQTGEFIADTGNQIDAMVNEQGFYPESRSDNKGSEPEMVVCFEVDGIDYAAVGLERANGVALVSLAEPTKPTVVSVVAIDKSAKAGKVAPEGITHYYNPETNEHFVITANERNGSLSFFKFQP